MQQNHKVNGQRLDVKKALSKSEMAAGGPGGGGSSSGRRGGGRGGGSGGWGNQQDWGNSGDFHSGIDLQWNFIVCNITY